MLDTAHYQTDLILNNLTRDIELLYQRRFKELRPQIKRYLEEMYLEQEDATAQQRLKHAKSNDKLKMFLTFMAGAYLITNKNAIDTINDSLDEIYEINKTWAISEINNALDELIEFKDIAYDLAKYQNSFDKRAYDNLASGKHIRADHEELLIKGIKKGEDIEQLTNRIRAATNRSKNSSKRIALTESTRIENYARLQTYLEAQKLGIVIDKMWVSIRDTRTRRKPRDKADHWVLYGEVRDLKDKFSNGLLIPGDINGPVYEIVNCRCRIVAVIYIHGEKITVDGLDVNLINAK